LRAAAEEQRGRKELSYLWFKKKIFWSIFEAAEVDLLEAQFLVFSNWRSLHYTPAN